MADRITENLSASIQEEVTNTNTAADLRPSTSLSYLHRRNHRGSMQCGSGSRKKRGPWWLNYWFLTTVPLRAYNWVPRGIPLGVLWEHGVSMLWFTLRALSQIHSQLLVGLYQVCHQSWALFITFIQTECLGSAKWWRVTGLVPIGFHDDIVLRTLTSSLHWCSLQLSVKHPGWKSVLLNLRLWF